MEAFSKNEFTDIEKMNSIYVERIHAFFKLKEEEYLKRSKYKCIYKFVLSIDKLEKLDKKGHL